MISRQFYNLPNPGQVGLRWKDFEGGCEKISRLEVRRRESERAASDLEKRIREEKNDDVRRLAQSILAGKDDPAADTEALEDLAGELREQRRLKEALDRALPQAEEELRQTVFEHQDRWKEEADTALGKAIAEEHKAYAKAIEIIEGTRTRRMYLEALTEWVRYPSPSFNQPSDVAARSAIQRLEGDAALAEEKMHERLQIELAQAKQQEKEDVV